MRRRRRRSRKKKKRKWKTRQLHTRDSGYCVVFVEERVRVN